MGLKTNSKLHLKIYHEAEGLASKTMDKSFGLEILRSKSCKMKLFLPLVFFLFAQIISSASENWPRFRGNNGDGRADFTIPPVWKKSDYRWSLDLDEEGHGSPSVWKNRVFLNTAIDKGKTREVICVNANHIFFFSGEVASIILL